MFTHFGRIQMGYLPPKDENDNIIELLKSDGFIIESDTTVAISVTGCVSDLEEALEQNGWVGNLVCATTEHGGE
ncbi:MAG: hypothetical protein AAGH40_14825 [Verrucomicrobiota bacterium]